MKFATKGMEMPATGSKYLDLGINDNVSLFGIYSGASASKGTPFLEVEIGKSDDATNKFPFWMSDATQERSQQRIIHLLVDALGVSRESVDNAGEKATSLDDYARKLSSLIPKGNKFRVKLTGEEYYKDGEVKVKKTINSKFFAEPMSVSPSRLKFDKTNKYDYTVAPVPNDGTTLEAPQEAMPGTGDDDQLPF